MPKHDRLSAKAKHDIIRGFQAIAILLSYEAHDLMADGDRDALKEAQACTLAMEHFAAALNILVAAGWTGIKPS